MRSGWPTHINPSVLLRGSRGSNSLTAIQTIAAIHDLLRGTFNLTIHHKFALYQKRFDGINLLFGDTTIRAGTVFIERLSMAFYNRFYFLKFCFVLKNRFKNRLLNLKPVWIFTTGFKKFKKNPYV